MLLKPAWQITTKSPQSATDLFTSQTYQETGMIRQAHSHTQSQKQMHLTPHEPANTSAQTSDVSLCSQEADNQHPPSVFWRQFKF